MLRGKMASPRPRCIRVILAPIYAAPIRSLASRTRKVLRDCPGHSQRPGGVLCRYTPAFSVPASPEIVDLDLEGETAFGKLQAVQSLRVSKQRIRNSGLCFPFLD